MRTLVYSIIALLFVGIALYVIQNYETEVPIENPGPLPQEVIKKTPLEKAKEVLTPADASNTCTSDEDCMLGIKGRCTAICDPCESYDLSDPEVTGINQAWCQAERQKVIEKQTDEGIACLTCISAVTNTQSRTPRCVQNTCQ